VIGRAIGSLLAQRYPGAFRIVLVDDHSSDTTSAIASAAAEAAGAVDRLTIAAAEPLPAGWTGKLWAVSRGVEVTRGFEPDYLLQTVADMVHAAPTVAELVARAERGVFALVSLRVRLHCRSWYERMLTPAFVFFFFKLSPPRWVADPRRQTAAAAGGCMLIRRETLDRIGGGGSIRRGPIDHCAPARPGQSGGRVWGRVPPHPRSPPPHRSL